MNAELAARDLLNRVLGESLQEAARRAAVAADVATAGRPVVLQGCGEKGRMLARALEKHGKPALAFSDSDRGKWGTVVDGLEVLEPSKAAERYAASAAFVVSKWSPGDGYLDVERQLRELGAQVIVAIPYFYWQYPDDMMPNFFWALPQDLLVHREDILRAFELMADEESQRQFAGQVAWRLTLDYHALTPPDEANQYFVPNLVKLSDHEIFVDCGAFDGDTVRAFLDRCEGRFDSIHAFEPDCGSFAALETYVAGLEPSVRARVVLHPEATGSDACMLRFDASGDPGAKASDDGCIEVPCVRLDDAVERATYIKMDVEGAEHDTLLGAKGMIARDHPALAVCLYHNREDFFRLPILINELDPTAKLYCRGHCVDGYEFVAYALHD